MVCIDVNITRFAPFARADTGDTPLAIDARKLIIHRPPDFVDGGIESRAFVSAIGVCGHRGSIAVDLGEDIIAAVESALVRRIDSSDSLHKIGPGEFAGFTATDGTDVDDHRGGEMAGDIVPTFFVHGPVDKARNVFDGQSVDNVTLFHGHPRW